ncbi:hypothetical protein AVEN_228693-1 [Araneus ventricosus]|uniref:Uncharacterized protein n=1 Tax=Araneus ventricosus TaxID=182803 RepID=A0A4Y2MYH2_ARAVE|nr:hypothetical protein AVEN_228693-1 [Araneus ventricosus]
MPPKDKRSKRAKDAAELAKQYEISETFPNSTDLLNGIQQLQTPVEVLRNRQLSHPSSKIHPIIASVLTTIMESQKQLLERQKKWPNIIQITSTNDTSNSSQIFQGNIMEIESKIMISNVLTNNAVFTMNNIC